MNGSDQFGPDVATSLAAYDPGSVQRGVRYAAEGRVTVVDMQKNWAVGDVQGSRDDPVPGRGHLA